MPVSGSPKGGGETGSVSKTRIACVHNTCASNSNVKLPGSPPPPPAIVPCCPIFQRSDTPKKSLASFKIQNLKRWCKANTWGHSSQD